MTIDKFSIYFFALLIITSLFVHVSKRENRYRGSYVYFRAVVLSTGILTFIEMITWIYDGQSGTTACSFNLVSNYLLMYTSALPLTLWFLYFDYRIYYSEEKLRRRKYFYILINATIVFLVTVNIFKPFLFFISESNHFVGTRGALIVGVIQFCFLLSYVVMAIKNRRTIQSKVFKTIMVLAIFPIFGVVMQSFNYGTVFIWPMMTYVAFYAFLLIERDEMTKDSLTNLSLRGQMESRIINRLNKKRDFTLIMLDLDDFKLINDNYGHLKGDEVLKAFSQIMVDSIHKIDTAYRYAGDEFVILIEHIDDETVDCVIKRIHEKMDAYNKSSDMEHELSASYGIFKVSGDDHMELHDVIGRVDNIMYENKKKKKQSGDVFDKGESR